ncbi:sulfotransferase 2A1-like [Microcebus murinus]|uniref:sulfotransferase 2A1-like n=1 Tax=Microcebus murinus TaxID=30608 RepID=UPI00098B3974|nr:bile salt sulfotransferase-like isoform X3 [Microcebus murinus]
MTSKFLFEGIWMDSHFTPLENVCFARDEFLVKDDDVILVSFPRSGTHWMIEILSLIYYNGDPSWVQTVPNYVRSPWIESKDFQENKKKRDGSRLLTSHLPVQLFPKSYFTSNAKIIYIIRNPRDVVTSLYHLLKGGFRHKQPEQFDEFLNDCVQDNIVYGSWFDHVLGWIKRREMGSFLLIFYEELQKDFRGSVEKICQFLGKKLKPHEIDSVLQNSSFSAMKENKMSNYSTPDCPVAHVFTEPMLRKGISGDWKNHFTVAQSEAFDKLFQEKMSGLDAALFPWS